MAHTFNVEINWKRSNDFTYDTFSRDHTVKLSGDQIVNNSAAPAFMGNAGATNPEELLASALSSCHMLTFLVIAAKSGYIVDSYFDQAIATLDKNSEGHLAITNIDLRPIIKFSGEKIPDVAQLKSIHEKAHHNCFIANSINSKVNVL